MDVETAGPVLPPPHKRPRSNDGGGGGGAIVTYQQEQPQNENHVIRTSSLPSPTLQLTGHKGSVYALRYSPAGRTLCSASFDKTCLLWSHSAGIDDEEFPTALEPYQNYNVLTGHKNAVLDCAWCDEDTVVTASADGTVQLFDALTGKRLRKWDEHAGIVNAVAVRDENAVVSASDDGTCLLWDRRQKRPSGSLAAAATGESDEDLHRRSGDICFPVTAVAAGHRDHDLSHNVYTAGLDGMITCWDVRKTTSNSRSSAAAGRVYGMKGHTDTVTCLAMHPAGTHILSNSMDGTLQTWDVRQFVTNPHQRHDKTFRGHTHNAEKGLLKCSWSSLSGSGSGNSNSSSMMVTAGSADKLVHIWDEFSTQELYLLPGHKGCVNTVIFHPTENVIASGSSDKHIFVGELS